MTPAGHDVDGRDVSVILIVRNGERFIGEALESVSHQTVAPREILVIDGNSSDASVEVARRFTGVTVVPQKSVGLANAYNEGIAHARAPMLAFISHDDRWLPEKIERQLSFMRSEPDVLLSVTYVEHFLEEGSSIPAGFRTDLLDHAVPGYLMETLMARREVFQRVGHFDPTFAVSEDTDWFARVKDAGLTIGLVPETLTVKRVHDTNASLSHPAINGLLLRALRQSIARKRAVGSGE